jgi:hypothetical protein
MKNIHHFVFALAATCAVGAEPRVVEPSPKLLALDTRVFEKIENARLVLGEPEKDARNPLMPSDQPWENATNNYYPNVHWDAEEQTWKLWYKDVLADKEAIAQMERPSTVHDVGWYLLYATSKDGAAWSRPALGLHPFGGRNDTNAVARDCPNVGVFKDAHDPDSNRRYKMVFDVGLGKPFARFSADGIHWGEPVAMLGFTAQQGDTHNNAFFDPRSGKYLWFTKMYLGERLVSRLESDDFLHWRSSGVVLRSSIEEGRKSQTYALTVFPYGNIYLGFLMMYHVGKDRTVDVELAWSPDSIEWRRVQPGGPFLKLGAKDAIDSGTIYAQAGPMFVKDGRLQIYYGGSPTVHVGWKRNAHLCLATLREDGFAAYEPADASTPATLTTAPLRTAGPNPHVISDGDVKTETLPEPNGAIRLRLTLGAKSRVYALDGYELVNPALPPAPQEPLPHQPIAHAPITFTFDHDAQGWSAVDKIEAHDGYLTISRPAPLRPIAHATPLPGDWPTILGGDAVTISAKVRSTIPGGTIRMEICPADLAGWSYEKLPPFTADWQTIQTTIRYDWTDAEARAAGWVPAIQGFPWRDTLRHAGKLAILPSQSGPQSTFDLDDVRVEATNAEARRN